MGTFTSGIGQYTMSKTLQAKKKKKKMLGVIKQAFKKKRGRISTRSVDWAKLRGGRGIKHGSPK